MSMILISKRDYKVETKSPPSFVFIVFFKIFNLYSLTLHLGIKLFSISYISIFLVVKIYLAPLKSHKISILFSIRKKDHRFNIF